MGSRQLINLVKTELLRFLNLLVLQFLMDRNRDDWHNFYCLLIYQNIILQEICKIHSSLSKIRCFIKNAYLRANSSWKINHQLEFFLGKSFKLLISSRSHCIFHQIEGLYWWKREFCRFETNFYSFHNRTFENQKSEWDLHFLYGASAEVDVYWDWTETDYRITKGNRDWRKLYRNGRSCRS